MPAAGVTRSHDALELALNANAAPVLLTVTVLAAGAAWPARCVNERALVPTASDGPVTVPPALTLSVTELVALNVSPHALLVSVSGAV